MIQNSHRSDDDDVSVSVSVSGQTECGVWYSCVLGAPHAGGLCVQLAVEKGSSNSDAKLTSASSVNMAKTQAKSSSTVQSHAVAAAASPVTTGIL